MSNRPTTISLFAGLDAFTSREKIRHSPLEKVETLTSDKEQPEQFQSLESYDGPSKDDHTLELPPSQNANHQRHDEEDATHTNNELPKVDTAMLIDLGNGSLASSLADTKSKNRSEQNPDFAAWNVTLQKSSHSSKSPASQMLDRFEVETSADVNRDLKGAIVVEDLLQFMETDRPEGTILSDVEEKGLKGHDPSNSGHSKETELSENCNKTGASPLYPENVSLRDLHEPASPFHGLESPEVGIHLSSVSDKGDISSVHLDEELSDIFQTRTPQLPDRLRRKIEAEGESPQPPSNGSVSMHDSSLHLRTISGSSSTHEQFGLIPEVRKLDMTSSLEEDSSVSGGLDDRSMAVDRLNRTKSGSSQKSVTFSEQINRAVESISEETMPVMEDEWHTSPAHDRISPLRTDSPQREVSMQRSESGILGEEYLVSSPKPPLNQSSHIDDAFSIDLESPDGGEVFSMNRPIEDLLEHISPMISPSSTPQIPIGVRVSHRSDQSLVSPDVTPELPIISRPVTTVGAADTTPTIKRSSSERLHLSQKMASLRMTAGSVGVNGSPGHLYSKDSSEFNLLGKRDYLISIISIVRPNI